MPLSIMSCLTGWNNTTCLHQTCLTLNDYVKAPITSNSVFIFLPGRHEIKRPLVIRDVENVTLKASSTATVDGTYTHPILTTELKEERIDCVHIQHEGTENTEGMSLEACYSTLQLHNVIHANIHGIGIEIATPIISGVIVQNSTDFSIHLHVESELRVAGNDVGILIFDSSNIHLTALQTHNLSYGMILYSTTHANISNTVIEGSKRSGLVMIGTSSINVLNTSSSRNQENGIVFYSANNTVMEQMLSYYDRYHHDLLFVKCDSQS